MTEGQAEEEDATTAVARRPALNSLALEVASEETEFTIKIIEYAEVIEADILVTNGIIHIVDAVLIPAVEA